MKFTKETFKVAGISLVFEKTRASKMVFSVPKHKYDTNRQPSRKAYISIMLYTLLPIDPKNFVGKSWEEDIFYRLTFKGGDQPLPASKLSSHTIKNALLTRRAPLYCKLHPTYIEYIRSLDTLEKATCLLTLANTCFDVHSYKGKMLEILERAIS